MKSQHTSSSWITSCKQLSLHLLALGLLGVFSGFISPAFAQDEEPKKLFIESDVRLPAAAEEKNLLLFHRSETQQFFLDTKSLSIADDGSFRYTLVAKSNAGATSISYEGLRCDTLEKRLFAFGRKDGSWSESRNKDWGPISNSDSNRQQSILAWDFVCSFRRIAGKVDNVIQRIRQNESLQRSP